MAGSGPRTLSREFKLRGGVEHVDVFLAEVNAVLNVNMTVFVTGPLT